MRIVLAIAVITAFAVLLVTAHGKGCHYNVHLKQRLVCTD
jgi:hypothetical protein